MKQIATALLKAQSEMSNPIKGSKNPFFSSRYADLNSVREAVIPVLNAHGIVVLQPTINNEGRNFVKTILLHESGETIESITEILYSKTNDAQAQGSGITYARRYGLQSLVCVGADDDDGNAASRVGENINKQPTQQQPTKAPEQKPTPPKPEPFDSAKYEAEIKKIKTKAEMGKYWGDNKALQGVDEFKSLVNKYGTKLTQ